MPKNGSVAEPGLVGVAPGSGVIMMPPVSVCHQVSTIGTAFAADDFVIPHPGFGVDRLADRAEQAQRTQIVFLRPFRAPFHERANRRRRGVKDRSRRYFSTMRQKRSGSGKFGAPSYIRLVAPLASGP